MRYSWRQRLSNGITAATLSRFLIISALLSVGGLAMVASVSSSGPRSRSALARSVAIVASDRGTGRAAAARRAPEAMPLAPVPLIGTITVDRTDDAAGASACTGAANDCSLRGAIAFANLSPGTTINVPAGNYSLTTPGPEAFYGDNSKGDLDISGNNTSIVGAGAASTIITQTIAGERVIEVNPDLVGGFVASISGVRISGGSETSGVGGGGIISGSLNNSLTISNSIFSGNSATGAGSFGGGGICHTGGNLTITGTTFSSNSTSASGGGVSYSAGDPLGSSGSAGTLTVSGSTFTSNTANSAAAGGGALDLYDFNSSSSSYSVNTSSFSSNSAPNRSGGAIIVESGGPLTVATSSFTTNSAQNSGGAIFGSGSTASVTYSRLVGNTAPIGRDIFRGAGILTANDDWWGINTGPAAGNFSSPTGNIIPADWLQLRAIATPNTICVGATSSIAADIKQRASGGAPLTTELNGLPAFPATFINTTPAFGTLSGASANFVDGAASATFTGTAPGSAMIDVIADNQTVTATINVQNNATSDPADQAVCQGATATFTTTGSGPGPYSYAWTLDGSPFDGNNASISVPTGSLSPGSHTVSVTTTGACGSATQSATLTVNEATTTSDPADATVCQGATASFSTTAGGTGPFSYAWTVDGSAFGGNTSSISVPTGALSVGSHTVAVTTTGTCGSASQSATLTVNEATTTSDPADATVCQGATAGFSTTASGTGPFTYAWTVDGSAFGGNTSSISVPTGSLSVGSHTVAVTTSGTCGSASQSATLTVQPSTTTSDPADAAVCPGGTANFSTIAGGTGPFSYAWTVDGSAFGGNTSSISVSTGSLSVGNHTVAVTTTGTCGTASQSATLTVQEPTSTSDPADATVCLGATASFSTTAAGTGPFTYAWTVDGTPTGGNTSSVTVPTGSLSVGNHTVAVTTSGTCGSASQSATLTVQPSTATTDPADATVCQGATAGFSTTASGTGPFSYSWTVDGSAFGGDTSSISVPTGSLSVGNHTVAVTTTGTCGSASQSATLTVQETTSTTDPADATVCQGATASFSTIASGTGPFTYAWTVDGSAFGGNTSSISVPTGSLTLGSHTVAVTTTGTCGSASQSATLTVQENTSTTDPADATVCKGATASFSTTAGGTGPFTYAWTVDGMPSGTTSSITVATGSLSVGNHTVVVTTSGSCGSASQTATLTVQETTSATTPPSQTVCQGATATFSTTASGTGPFTYQWKLDGSNIAGATGSSVNINTSSLSAGSHSVDVVVDGVCGSVIRSTTLTVNTAPVVTLNPVSQTATSGTVTFTAAASGSPAPTVQWQVSTNGGASFSNISGATSTSLTVTVTPAVNGNQYRAVFTNGCGTATTTAATLTTCNPPVITLSNSTIAMWPPNHAYHTFNVTDFVASAISNCYGNITSSVVITSVHSDEVENGNGDGNTLNDIVIGANCKTVQLRSERDGGGNGRVYTINFRVTDASGNTTTATATVTVPPNQSGSAAVNGPGAGYTVTSACP
jgi:hypothetical protein